MLCACCSAYVLSLLLAPVFVTLLLLVSLLGKQICIALSDSTEIHGAVTFTTRSLPARHHYKYLCMYVRFYKELAWCADMALLHTHVKTMLSTYFLSFYFLSRLVSSFNSEYYAFLSKSTQKTHYFFYRIPSCLHSSGSNQKHIRRRQK